MLGAEICSTFEQPELATLGTCDLIDEIMVGEDKLVRFSGCKSGEACTIVLRGASSHVLDEAERITQCRLESKMDMSTEILF